MGGRGSSSGISDKGKVYGTEYSTLYQSGNIKFVRYNDSTSAKTPMETMTKGRVYVTINAKDEVSSITYYDNTNKRKRQIDLTHAHNGKKPHTHHGYIHDENGTTGLTVEEKKMIDKVKNEWYNRYNK
ncbi:putative uncharacterized protein [Ruminococcus sp. CAG:579]|jgi:hypothetical protein|nr:putative uncharacterized protein [Ruminococcus sp. CAG:579]